MALAIQQSEKPIGTVAEAEEAGLSIARFATCASSGGPCKGCPWHDKNEKTGFPGCQFLPIAKQLPHLQGGKIDGKGPFNVGIEITNGGNKTFNAVQMQCSDYYTSGLYQRHRMREITGDRIRVVAYEGDGRKIRQKETHLLHKTPDPKCSDCMAVPPKCRKQDPKKAVNEAEVDKFLRPRENPQLMELIMARDAERYDEVALGNLAPAEAPVAKPTGGVRAPA